MLCARPYRVGNVEHGCGTCLPCRVNRRRLWTGRLLLEATSHQTWSWPTLTYDQNHNAGTLNPDHVAKWLKDLRRESGERIRYFYVGEYGDRTFRPHYHCVIYGLSRIDLLARCWQHGHIYLGDPSPASIAYNCAHITKSVHHKAEIEAKGLYPEFQRMSLKPGIGCHALQKIADWHNTEKGSQYIADNFDVCTTFRLFGRQWHLGKYLTRKLRVMVGMDPNMPQERREVLAADRKVEIENDPELYILDGVERSPIRERKRRDINKRIKVKIMNDTNKRKL